MTTTVDAVLAAYRGFMHALQTERAKRGSDPWYECPMTLPQLRALGLIASNERGLSSRELAASLSVGASAITPLVDRLVERGFVTRHEDPHDRRIARLHATENGSALIERMHSVETDLMRDVLAQLRPTELATVSAALDVLRAGVERAGGETQLSPQGIPA